MIVEVCQRVIEEIGMPVEWTLNIGVPIYKGKDDSMNCCCYCAM